MIFLSNLLGKLTWTSILLFLQNSIILFASFIFSATGFSRIIAFKLGNLFITSNLPTGGIAITATSKSL